MEAIAYYDPGADITCRHTAGSPGARCVSYPIARSPGGPSGISDTGDGILTVTTPAAAAQIFGVTSHDVAAGGTVNIMRAPKVVPIEASAAIVVGDPLVTGTDGRVAKAATGNIVIGRALTDGGVGTLVAVDLYHQVSLMP